VGKKQDSVETGADLICPYCESPVEKVDAVSREFNKRGVFGIRSYVIAIACPTCHKVLGFFPT
jgi:endogenous inhibitor of DNA gyrase (YacG/DUF329 family)